jgi:hypothetical protein
MAVLGSLPVISEFRWQEGQLEIELLDNLGDGIGSLWVERDVGQPHTSYRVVLDEGEPVLVAESRGTASALWRDVRASRMFDGSIMWQWKVLQSLAGISREHERGGDDYAARVFVIFGAGANNLGDSRALCYVWAGNAPVESAYRSPYTDNVVTIVLQSGNARSGEWVTEKRDFVADYRTAFDEPPDVLAAVALMVDTDNTKSEATTFFKNLKLVINDGAGRR